MNKQVQSSRQLLHSAIVVALFTLTACATTGGQNSNEPKIDTAKYATVTTHEAVNQLESTFRDSDRKDLDVYAPDHYLTAAKALEEAKQLLVKSQPREKVVQKVAVAEAVLKNGDRVMRKVKDILHDEIAIKEKLDTLNTENAYGAEYGSLNERLSKIIREIEAGNNADAENREKLLKDMRQLERKAIHYNAMNEPREILKRVRYRGGEQLAPITYSEALAVFKRAEEFIQKNPDYEIGIMQMGREALFAAKRALYITEGVAALKQKVAFAPEQIILDEEYRMYRVARHLGNLDYRDSSLEVQSELLAKEAESIAQELKNKDELVIALRDTLIKVRDSSSRLTMLSESTVKLKKEKNEWLAKEALFTAKVAQLEEQLKNSEMQLDSTQQKLLAIKTENTKLAQQIQQQEQQTLALQNKLKQIELAQQQNKTQQPALAQTPPKTKALATTDANKPPTPEKTVTVEKIIEQPATPENIAAETKEEPQATETSIVKKQIIEKIVEKSEPVQTAEEAEAIEKKKQLAILEEEKHRAKITEQETLEALNSAKELLKSLQSTEKQIAGNSEPAKTEDTTDADDFLDEEDAFVDAGE